MSISRFSAINANIAAVHFTGFRIHTLLTIMQDYVLQKNTMKEHYCDKLFFEKERGYKVLEGIGG